MRARQSVRAPSMVPPGQLFTIGCETPKSTIYYTLDGSKPSLASSKYTAGEPFSLTDARRYEVKAVSLAFARSATHVTTEWEVQEYCADPTFSPAVDESGGRCAFGCHHPAGCAAAGRRGTLLLRSSGSTAVAIIIISQPTRKLLHRKP